MKQKERIINDVREVLKFYELGQYTARGAVVEIKNLTSSSCDNCVYCGNCLDDDKKTCANGFSEFLESEA